MNMRDDLKAFVDNELSEADRTRILKELENNPELQAEVIELRQMSRMIREEAWQPEPVGLERTLRALDGAKPKKPWWMTGPLQLVAGAACVALAVVVFFPVFAQSKASAKNLAFRSANAEAAASMPMEDANRSLDYDAKKGMDSQAEAGWGGGNAPAAGKAEQERFGGSPKLRQDQRILMSPESPARSRGGSPSPTPGDSAKMQERQDLRFQPTFANVQLEVKTAELAIEVADVPKGQLQAEAIAKDVKGRIQSSSKQDDEGQVASARLTLRVPVASFQTAVNRIRKLGRVTGDTLSSDDVTVQVADTEARLKVLRAEENQYAALMKSTKKVSEVLEVKDKLGQTRQEIESMDATRKALRGQAAESTINLEIRAKQKRQEPVQSTNWSNDTFAEAVTSLNAVGRKLGGGAVYLYVFAPIWLPVALVSWWGFRRRVS